MYHGFYAVVTIDIHHPPEGFHFKADVICCLPASVAHTRAGFPGIDFWNKWLFYIGCCMYLQPFFQRGFIYMELQVDDSDVLELQEEGIFFIFCRGVFISHRSHFISFAKAFTALSATFKTLMLPKLFTGEAGHFAQNISEHAVVACKVITGTDHFCITYLFSHSKDLKNVSRKFIGTKIK